MATRLFMGFRLDTLIDDTHTAFAQPLHHSIGAYELRIREGLDPLRSAVAKPVSTGVELDGSYAVRFEHCPELVDQFGRACSAGTILQLLYSSLLVYQREVDQLVKDRLNLGKLVG